MEGCLGFYRAEEGAGRDTPDIDRREEKRIRIYRRDRTGSALVSMLVGMGAELGSAEMSMLVPGCWSSGTLPGGRGPCLRPDSGVPAGCGSVVVGGGMELRNTRQKGCGNAGLMSRYVYFPLIPAPVGESF